MVFLRSVFYIFQVIPFHSFSIFHQGQAWLCALTEVGEVDRADDVHGLPGGRHLGDHQPQGGPREEEHRQL